MKTQIMKYLIMITISVIAALVTFSTSGHAQILKGRVVAYSAGEPTLVLKEWEVTVDTTAAYVPYTLPSFLSVVIPGHFGNYELYTHRVSQELGLEHQDSYNFSVKVDPNMQDGDIVHKEYYYYNLASTKPILAPSIPDTQPITVTQSPDTQPIPAPNNPGNPIVPNSPTTPGVPEEDTASSGQSTANKSETGTTISKEDVSESAQVGAVEISVNADSKIQRNKVELPETAAVAKPAYGIVFVLTVIILIVGMCIKTTN